LGYLLSWSLYTVETEDPENLDDVSKCHMLMLPHSNAAKNNNSKGSPYRLLTFGRKHLPASRDEGNHEVEWGRITAVGDDLKELKDALGPSTYETKVGCIKGHDHMLWVLKLNIRPALACPALPRRPEEHAINQLHDVPLKGTTSSEAQKQVKRKELNQLKKQMRICLEIFLFISLMLLLFLKRRILGMFRRN